MMYRYVVIDGHKYAVASATYVRRWARLFSALINTVGIHLNFIDRGPGIRVYSFTLILTNWKPDSLPYKDGITQTLDQQRQNLEASYAKIAKSLQFLDPFGEPPSASKGVFFTNLNEIIPNYSTVEDPYVLMEVELTESTQVIG